VHDQGYTMPLASRSRYPLGAFGAAIEWIRLRLPSGSGRSDGDIVTALYRGMLEREPDPGGFADKVGVLRAGMTPEQLVRDVIGSPEFRDRMLKAMVPGAALPDLKRVMPERYEPATAASPLLYLARTDDDIALMEALIRDHRYCYCFDAWSPAIDTDKQITAAIVRGLGARGCFQMGCFTGPVLSLLADAGISVAGCETSHSAFALAYPNIRGAMIYGDLTDLEIGRKFDVIVCTDVLEHVNPLRLDRYIGKLLSLLGDDGWIYVNAAMFGRDEVFATAQQQVVDEWRALGDEVFWRQWPCDESGWLQHGQLIWASPNWWTAQFAAHGLRRDHVVERMIHYRLTPFFERAPERRSLFVLRHPNSRRSSTEVATALSASLAALPGVAG
jgi:hypothetical protein